MEYSDARFMQQSVGPITVRHTLNCIAADTIWIFIHTCMYNTENKLVICQLQNAKSNFSRFCKVYARQNQKTNLIYLYIHLVETFNSSFKKLFFKHYYCLSRCHFDVFSIISGITLSSDLNSQKQTSGGVL